MSGENPPGDAFNREDAADEIAPPGLALPGQRLHPDRAIVYLTVTVHERAKRLIEKRNRARRGRRVQAPRESFTTLALAAVAWLHAEERLAQVVRAADRVAGGGGGLFMVRPVKRRTLAQAARQVSLEPGEANVTILDDLAVQLGVSRSALVDRALAAYLDAHERG